MPKTNADRLLSRITALHQSLHLDDGGHITSMERDLMMNYLREFYEFYASSKVTEVRTPVRDELPTPPPRPAPTPAPAARPPASVTAPPKVSVPPEPPTQYQRQEAAPAASAPPPRQAPTPPPAAPARPAPAVPSVPVPAPPAPAMTKRTATVAPTSAPASAPNPPRPAPVASPSPESKELAALFAEPTVVSRFGRQAIPDLTRALSINNRILFTRELFGGDNDLLGTTMQQLNAAGSFASAKPLISSLVRRFNWVDEDKQETAREFIELTRRRYV